MAGVKFENGYKGVGWLKKQWPWWTAGLLTALAEIINYLFIPWGHPKHKFIGVTSGFARMYAHFESTLFGKSLIATKPDYQPALQWIIIGAFIGALLFAWLEGEWRSWVKYPKKMLVFTALGAFFFAWGTRVAGGCTLHHLLGGVAAFNIKSFVVMGFATVGALIGFKILTAQNIAQYFKSQDTKWYVKQANEYRMADGLTYNEGPSHGWLRYALYAYLILFFLVALYGAFAGNDYAIKMGWAESLEQTKIYKNMLIGKNIPTITLQILVGVLLGISVAKTGFGTECGLINPEMANMIAKDEKAFARKWKMPYSLRTVMLSLQPFAALALHMTLFGLVLWIGFTFFGIMEGHHWATKEFAEMYAQATGMEFHKVGVAIREMTSLPMDIFGGLLLGIGTVFMLGCEFRNYGRTGLLYITGLLIWIFFYVGYLPYTLARDFWDGLMGGYPYTPTTFGPALIAPTSKTAQSIIYLLYILMWAALFVWAVKKGAKNIGVKPKEILWMNSEDMYLKRLEKLEKEGKLEEMVELERELYDQAEKA